MPKKNRTFKISSRDDALKVAKLIVAERDGDTTYKPAIQPIEEPKIKETKTEFFPEAAEELLYRDNRKALNIKNIN